MKTHWMRINGLFGPQSIQLPLNGEIIQFDRDVDHGDWKTASVRPGKWPTIPKGTKVKMLGHMLNCYGLHLRVEHAGQEYDIEAHRLVRE